MANLSNMATLTRVNFMDSIRKPYRLECLQFDGINFKVWWVKLDQFFEAEGVNEQAKVRVVMLHLDDTYLDPMSELVALKQVGLVDQYHDRFPDVGQYLRLFKPQTSVDGYQLARQVEGILSRLLKRTFIVGNWGNHPKSLLPSSKPLQTTGSVSTGIGFLSNPCPKLRWMTEGKKGLCFLCAIKYTPGHKCVKSQMYQLLLEADPEQESEPESPTFEEFMECKEQLEVIDQDTGTNPLTLLGKSRALFNNSIQPLILEVNDHLHEWMSCKTLRSICFNCNYTRSSREEGGTIRRNVLVFSLLIETSCFGNTWGFARLSLKQFHTKTEGRRLRKEMGLEEKMGQRRREIVKAKIQNSRNKFANGFPFFLRSWCSILTAWEAHINLNGVKTPNLETTWTINDDKLINVNLKPINAIFNGIDPQKFSHISKYTIVKKAWIIFGIVRKGTITVK
ncbi:hypothetical protein J1N35_038285 [Gossypium stocksii]|uniref:Uncharacterized protein n=1 Tax=Gossypium stocksii TaxID=47602 RepID=A0A9D3ULS2_9ROSI|nr:hypothetical protein J1N35_038285 [Gossypium stocksii]